MKKLLLISTLMLMGLSGCYIVPLGHQEGGYRGDQDRHEGGARHGNHDDRGGEHGGRDDYH